MENRIKELESELAELKLQITNSQPLFTLTAVEMGMLEMDILPDSIEEYKTHGRWSREKLEFCKNLLTRIKEWQDEHNK